MRKVMVVAELQAERLACRRSNTETSGGPDEVGGHQLALGDGRIGRAAASEAVERDFAFEHEGELRRRLAVELGDRRAVDGLDGAA